MKIIFVYNADSGIVNSIIDSAHKFLRPETYSCNLCDLTFGIIRENKEWKSFRKSSNAQLEFLHRDEFEKKYDQKHKYPLILTMSTTGELKELISHERLNLTRDVKELIQLLRSK